MKKRDTPIMAVGIGVIVGLLIGAGGIAYALIFATIPGAGVAVIVSIAIAVGFIAAMAFVVRDRVREIRKEDPNDYRKY